MSFLDYLHDHRGQFVDHRATTPVLSGPSAQQADDALDHLHPAVIGGGGTAPSSGRAGKRKRSRDAVHGVRFRLVTPLHAPLPYSDPLPYEEPWERAFR